MAAAVRLTVAAEALAALAAHHRVRTESLDIDADLAELLAAIATEVTGADVVDSPDLGLQVVGMASALLREATSLIADPGRVGDWSSTDPSVLNGIGRISMAIAPVFGLAAAGLTGLADSLARSRARFLDVGTGTGWLAIATARTFPEAHIVGIDVFEPALALARMNVAREQMADRVELRQLDVTALDEPESYDAVWLPLPFLARAVVPAAIQRAVRALRPGGWLLPGTFAGPEDDLGRLLTELRIRRSGGHPWTADQLSTLLTGAGLEHAQEVPRTWPAPVRLFAARRPEAATPASH
jgi:SAM-dependent methyltransferase